MADAAFDEVDLLRNYKIAVVEDMRTACITTLTDNTESIVGVRVTYQGGFQQSHVRSSSGQFTVSLLLQVLHVVRLFSVAH